MYVRIRQNPSGTKTIYLIDSVRIKGKKHSYAKMVKCFGSSDNLAQLEQWIDEAKRLKKQLESQNISVSKLTQMRAQDVLSSCKVSDIGYSHFYRSMYARVFGRLKLPGVNDSTLAALVSMRITQPVSKLRTVKTSEYCGIEELSINKIYKLMDALDDKNIAEIKKAVFNNTKSLLSRGEGLRVLFYDLTTIYFEANKASELKELGFSKDGKSQHVQISLAIIVSNHGLPIGYELFKGNSFEGHTLIPTLNKLRKDYKIDDVTIVADSAMLSDANITALENNGFKYIVAARVRNMDKATTKAMLEKDGYVAVGSTNDDLRYKVIKPINRKKKQELEQISNKRLICCYSEERRRKDEYDRKKALNRIEKALGKSIKSQLKGALQKPYVTTDTADTISINDDKLEAAKKMEVYFGYITNADLSATDIMQQYRGLWQVEQTFRITKHNLKIRPVYHYVDRRIKAHFAICYLSLALLRTTELSLRQAKQYLPIEALHDLLGQIRQVILTIGNSQCKILSDLPDKASDIFAALNIALPKTYSVMPANL